MTSKLLIALVPCWGEFGSSQLWDVFPICQGVAWYFGKKKKIFGIYCIHATAITGIAG
jgi:hypothetical protein